MEEQSLGTEVDPPKSDALDSVNPPFPLPDIPDEKPVGNAVNVDEVRVETMSPPAPIEEESGLTVESPVNVDEVSVEKASPPPPIEEESGPSDDTPDIEDSEAEDY